MTSAADHPRRWCTFRLGDACFAVDSGAVVEVMRSRRLARVPLAAPGVSGLVHLRGRIVPVIDPAIRLGVGRVTSSGPGTHLVIAIGDDWYGLAVDEMLDVLEIPRGRVERPTAPSSRGEAVAGSFAAEGRLVHLLDPEHLLHSLVRQPPLLAIQRGGSHGSG